MAQRANITVERYRGPDSEGREGFIMSWSPLDGSARRGQAFFTTVDSAVKRLRHNMARGFWFYRMRARLAKENEII